MFRTPLVDGHLRAILQEPVLFSLVEFLPLDPTQEKGHYEGHQPVPKGISASIALKGDPEHKNTFLLLVLLDELNVSVKFFKEFENNKD